MMSESVSNIPEISNSVLERIGNTSLLQLRNIVPKDHARILIKLESENPTGSMKDRMALAMVEAAEKDGRLKSGGRVVEYTGGSTGVSLSLVCTVKGYPLDIVTSDAFSNGKRSQMAALGAVLTIIKSDSGGMDEALTRNMIEAAHMLMNQRRRRGLYGGRESGAVGPLEASRGAEVDWASVWRTLIVCLSPVDAARGDRNPSRED